MASAPTFTGAKAMVARLEAIARKIPNEAGKRLFQQGLVIEGQAIRLTPVEFGALNSSSETARPVISGGNVSVTISFGGPSAPYAAAVHENLSARHRVGQAKYLEQPVLEAMPTLAGKLGRDFMGGL